MFETMIRSKLSYTLLEFAWNLYL